MIITANGAPVLSMRLALPPSGIWIAALDVDADKALTGALSLEQSDVKYSGTVIRSGVLAGRCHLEAVGGKGGIYTKEVDSQSYNNVTCRDVLTDLLGAVGERLDTETSTRDVLATQLPYWSRAAGRAGEAIAMLADELKCRWRVLPSGLVWFGTDTWPAMADDYKAVEMDRSGGAGRVLLAPETIALRPGVTLKGERVGRVEHTVGQGPMRTTFWVE